MIFKNKKIGLLPKTFNFKTAKDILRLGKNYDGGYLVSKKDVIDSQLLLSLGICDDWSFEEDFINLKKVPIFAFDGSVNSWVFFYKIILNIFRLNKPFRFIKKINIFFSYIKFFREDRKHISKFVEGELQSDSRFNSKNYITMADVFKSVNNFDNIFLKIDIEGSEYRILNDLIQNQSRISGLAIEFHNCDLHHERISDFINKFALNLIHIHPNNAGPLNKKNKIPFSLEMTFSRSINLEETYILPHPLDMPCDPYNEDIFLEF